MFGVLLLAGLGADLTTTDSGAEVARLEGFTLRPVELRLLFNGGQPEAQLVGKVVARSSSSVALDEGRGAEVLKARARAGQGLPAAFRSSCRVHDEAVADPEAVPAGRAVWNIHRLAVNGDDVGGSLADDAPGDVGPDGRVRDGHHGDWRIGGEPEGLVVPARVVAHVVRVAEEERHRVEPLDTRAGHAQVLIVSLLVALRVEQTVALPQFNVARLAERHGRRLAVLYHEEARLEGGRLVARTANVTLLARRSGIALKTIGAMVRTSNFSLH